eukprot:Em0001g2827a
MAITILIVCSLLFHLAKAHSNVCPAPPAAGVSYRFNISVPAGCTPYTSNCTFFAALRTNDNSSAWLDYYMEGLATGYLALGWNNVSQTPLSDIIACAYNSQTRAVQVVDTWVDANNAVLTDSNYAYLCNQSAGTYGGGRMSCSYSRSYSTHDTVNDYRIDGLFYALYGLGDTAPTVGVNNTLSFASPFNLTVTPYTINPRWYPSTAAPVTTATTSTVVTKPSSSSGAARGHVLLFLICVLATLFGM